MQASTPLPPRLTAVSAAPPLTVWLHIVPGRGWGILRPIVAMSGYSEAWGGLGVRLHEGSLVRLSSPGKPTPEDVDNNALLLKGVFQVSPHRTPTASVLADAIGTYKANLGADRRTTEEASVCEGWCLRWLSSYVRTQTRRSRNSRSAALAELKAMVRVPRVYARSGSQGKLSSDSASLLPYPNMGEDHSEDDSSTASDDCDKGGEVIVCSSSDDDAEVQQAPAQQAPSAPKNAELADFLARLAAVCLALTRCVHDITTGYICHHNASACILMYVPVCLYGIVVLRACMKNVCMRL